MPFPNQFSIQPIRAPLANRKNGPGQIFSHRSVALGTMLTNVIMETKQNISVNAVMEQVLIRIGKSKPQ